MTLAQVLSRPFPGRARRIVERNVFVYRRTWFVLISGFVEPLFFLLAIAYGVGSTDRTAPGPGR